MSPSPVVAEKLCCNADTDSRPNSPVPIRRHSPQPTLASNPTPHQPALHDQNSTASHTEDDIIELQQIFAEASSTLPPPTDHASSMLLLKHPRSRSAATVKCIEEEKHDRGAPKKNKLFNRLARDLNKSNLSLLNLKKAAAAKGKERKGQQPEISEKKIKRKGKAKEKSKTEDSVCIELPPTSPNTREVLLSRTYDSDAASLPDIRDSVVERLTKTLVLPNDDKEKTRMSPVRGKGSDDERGDVKSIDLGGNGDGSAPYGWGGPSCSTPMLSVRISEPLTGLGILPSCNVSVDDPLQLYQPSGRSSPWKKFAEQHLPRRSKSADMLLPSSPDLKPTELPSLSSSFTTTAYRISSDGKTGFPLSEAKHTVLENKDQGKSHGDKENNASGRFEIHHVIASPSHHYVPDATLTYRTGSEAPSGPDHDYSDPMSSAACCASANMPPGNLRDSEAASLHLHNMRISQHLRSESTLSGVSHTTSDAATQSQQRSARMSLASGLCVPPLNPRQSSTTVRPRALRSSSSGFASEKVPDAWGNVISTPSSVYGITLTASEKAYEPSSVYSSRQNSLLSTPAVSRVNVNTSVAGGGGNVKKSGYKVLNLGDVGIFKVEMDTDDGVKDDRVKAPIPRALPSSSSMNSLDRTDTGLTFQAAREGEQEDNGKRSAYETSDSSDQTTGAGAEDPLRSNQQNSESTTDSSLGITPVTATESPVPSEKTIRATNAKQVPSKQPDSRKDDLKTPKKRFSTFSFFRSKTYANLRRASHSPALRARTACKSSDDLIYNVQKSANDPKELRGTCNNTDGPSDSPRPKSPMASEAMEDHEPGRLSRSWLIGNGRDLSGNLHGQGAVWERALQKHRQEKSALFLSPEKGGRAQARGLFRERSGSGSAVSTRSKQSDRKGKARAIGEDFTFGSGEGGSRLERSPTVLLDPLEKGAGEELVRHRRHSGMLGDELRNSQSSGRLTQDTGVSSGTSTTHQPGIESIGEEQHITSWGGTTLAEVDLGGLDAWSRYPSHTRDQRTGPAGESDNVRTRDFAYEMVNASTIEDANFSSEEDENTRSGIKRLATLRSKKRSKTRSGMHKTKSMTFSHNFSFLKHYVGLFRSQSEEFRKHGHGHRSSIAESGTLEHPELEILPPVFSPVIFDFPGNPMGYQNDGADVKATKTIEGDDQDTTIAEGKEETKVEFQLPKMVGPNRRQGGNTDSSDGSWVANARLWTRAFGSETDHSKDRLLKQPDSSTEWWNNARTWTRFSTPSQDFMQLDTPPKILESQAETPAEDLEQTLTLPGQVVQRTGPSKHSKRSRQISSDEWRSDARLFSQMYESCVQVPNFGSSDGTSACEAARMTAVPSHQKSSSAATAFRVASTGLLDGIVAQGAAANAGAKMRTMSGSYTRSAGSREHGLVRNDSALSAGSVSDSAMDLARFLQGLEGSEKAK